MSNLRQYQKPKRYNKNAIKREEAFRLILFTFNAFAVFNLTSSFAFPVFFFLSDIVEDDPTPVSQMTSVTNNAAVIKIKAIDKKSFNSTTIGSETSKRENEIAVLESQLTASIRLQIENIRAGICQMDLVASETLPRTLPGQLSSIVSLCDETDAMISNYNFIKSVSRTHANFQKTRAIYDQFKVLDEQIDRVNELLQEDIKSGKLNNLLLIYCRLDQLVSFRDDTLEMIKSSSSSLLYQLKRN